MNVHPLIHLADTVQLSGDPHAVLSEEADRQFLLAKGQVAQLQIISATQLGEYILSKRLEWDKSHANIFPIPKSTRKPITVRAKTKITK